MPDPGCPRDPKYGPVPPLRFGPFHSCLFSWRPLIHRLSMDGKYVSLGVSGAYDVEYLPSRCNLGSYGNSNEPLNQKSGTCTGPCPAGNYCPNLGTVDPIICPAGSWCPEGSGVRFCPAGYFSDQTGNLPPSASTLLAPPLPRRRGPPFPPSRRQLQVRPVRAMPARLLLRDEQHVPLAV